MDQSSSWCGVRGCGEHLVFVDCGFESTCNALVLVAENMEDSGHILLDLGNTLVHCLAEASLTAVVKDQGVLGSWSRNCLF